MAEPRVFYRHSTGKTNLAIYDNRSAVISPVQASQFPELNRSKSFNSPAGAFQIRKFPKRDIFRAEVIQQNANSDIS